jgi:hypothetical protein
MKKLPPFVFVALAVALSIGAGGNRRDSKETDKIDLVLRANPVIAFAPARITLVARLKGVSNDNADFYCPTVQWDWGDGTVSESSSDCEPFQPNKSEIQRSFTIQHVYKTGGQYDVELRLKRQDKVVAAAGATLKIGRGIGEDDGDVIR